MTHDEEFREFMSRINDLFVERFQMGYQHFPDWNYYDCFDDGMTPLETFEEWEAEYWPG